MTTARRPARAILLAAGTGTRLGRYTEDRPKCLLPFLGEPLIAWQVRALRACGVHDIVVVRGYRAEYIQLDAVRFRLNPDYARTNMLATLFAAEDDLEGDVLVCYTDILYEPRLIAAALDFHGDVGVVVDGDYRAYWQARLDDPARDVESLRLGADGRIVDIGRPGCAPEDAALRYVGILRFSPRGIAVLKAAYHRHRATAPGDDTPWGRSPSFRKAYMTCMLQALIDAGQRVDPIVVSRGWLEFDTEADYERVRQWSDDGSLRRFIDPAALRSSDGAAHGR